MTTIVIKTTDKEMGMKLSEIGQKSDIEVSRISEHAGAPEVFTLLIQNAPQLAASAAMIIMAIKNNLGVVEISPKDGLKILSEKAALAVKKDG